MGSGEDNLSKIPFRNSYHRLIANIYCTSGVMVNKVQAHLEKYELTFQQYNILKILQHAWPEAMMMSRVKDRMIDKNSDLTRITDRLIAKKLVKREKSPENRRIINLKLTPEAMEIMKGIEIDMQGFESMVNYLSVQEADTLNELLDKIRLHKTI